MHTVKIKNKKKIISKKKKEDNKEIRKWNKKKVGGAGRIIIKLGENINKKRKKKEK